MQHADDRQDRDRVDTAPRGANPEVRHESVDRDTSQRRRRWQDLREIADRGPSQRRFGGERVAGTDRDHDRFAVEQFRPVVGAQRAFRQQSHDQIDAAGPQQQRQQGPLADIDGDVAS